ncbi:HAD hydrolase-like protein [Streptomyces rubiginosohelvolus]|uniref:HAD hydrolase-like protein n=1 Tax=Streptomyces rubiginosohelvolus TaxID=67362 RepID=UPI0036FB069C
MDPVLGRIVEELQQHGLVFGDLPALLGSTPERTVLIGDSVSDIEAARAAAATSIGFANKPAKEATLDQAGADAIVLDMSVVARALAEPRP